jgi:hypothetical protein
MDDDGSALRVGAKYKSFTDLECALKKFQQDNYVQLYKRSSRKLGTGSKYKNMEVAESAADLLIYKELDYSCIHGGKNLVPFPTINAQTQGKITYNIP